MGEENCFVSNNNGSHTHFLSTQALLGSKEFRIFIMAKTEAEQRRRIRTEIAIEGSYSRS